MRGAVGGQGLEKKRAGEQRTSDRRPAAGKASEQERYEIIHLRPLPEQEHILPFQELLGLYHDGQ